MTKLSFILLAVIGLTSCETCPTATESVSRDITVTINGAPYQVTTGTKISYRDAKGRFTKLSVQHP